MLHIHVASIPSCCDLFSPADSGGESSRLGHRFSSKFTQMMGMLALSRGYTMPLSCRYLIRVILSRSCSLHAWRPWPGLCGYLSVSHKKVLIASSVNVDIVREVHPRVSQPEPIDCDQAVCPYVVGQPHGFMREISRRWIVCGRYCEKYRHIIHCL